MDNDNSPLPTRKPSWLKVGIPHGQRWRSLSDMIARRGLHTVCDEAACPNKAECWACGTATFMVLGDTCTRNCRFCAVATGRVGSPVNQREPEELAGATAELGLRYVVLTSVDRDDLADRGAGHFAACVSAIKRDNPGVLVETLIPDFRGDELDTLLAAGPDVVAHNIETVRRLQGVRDARATFDLSIRTLAETKSKSGTPTKSSILLGLGETPEEVLSTLDDLKGAGCNSVVLGQYLRPTPAQVPVVEYVTPESFAAYAREARARNFASVVSGPLARTSYHARQAFDGQAPS